MNKKNITVFVAIVFFLLITPVCTAGIFSLSSKIQSTGTVACSSTNGIGIGNIDTTPPLYTFEFGKPKTTECWYGKTYVVISYATPIWINSTDPDGVGAEKIQYSLWRATSPYPNHHGIIDMVQVYEKTVLDGSVDDKNPVAGEVSVKIFINPSCLYQIRFQCWDYEGNTDGQHSNDFLVDGCTPVTSLTVGQPQYMKNNVRWVTNATPLWFNATDKSYLPKGTGVETLIIEVFWKRNLSDPNESWQWNRTITIQDNDANDSNQDCGKITYDFSFNDQCCYTLKWHAIDVLGNSEVKKKTTLLVDSTSPQIITKIGDPNSTIIPDEAYGVTTQTPITFSAHDEGCMGGVGLKTFKYNIYFNGNWLGWTFLNPSGQTIHFSENGLHFVLLQAMDRLGNNAAVNMTFYVGVGGPLADAGGPYTAMVNEQILFDASKSCDMNGSLIGYRWDFNSDGVWDTAWLTAPTFIHSYTNAGSYTIKLQIIDNHNVTDEDTALVTVTMDSPVNHPPFVPSGPDPANNAINVGIYADVWWSGGDPDNDPVLYDVFFGTTNPPHKVSSGQSETTYNPGKLTRNTKYYWQIIAHDDNGANTSGPIWRFTTSSQQNRPPLKPSSPSPSNGSVDLETSILLSVYVSDPNEDSLTVQFYDSDNQVLIGSTLVPSGSTASVLWSALQYSTIYHWYAVANDSILSNRSEVWSFKTRASYSGGGGGGGSWNSPPIADVSAGEPYQGVVGEPVLLNGSKSRDPDGTIVSFRWTFGDSLNGTGKTVTHIYFRPGLFNVTLTVRDNQDAMDIATTIAVIILPNRPPAKPLITGLTNGTRNTTYTFIVTSTDPDNESVYYSFNWGDGTPTETSREVANATPLSIAHQWKSYGFYTITVKAFDNKTQSAPAYYHVRIDVDYVRNLGYLIDLDGDHDYDSFYSNQTKNETIVQKLEFGTYLIDTNADGKYEYLYNPLTKQLTPYSSKVTEVVPNADPVKILSSILGIILVLFLLILILSRKKKTKSVQPSVQPVKSEPTIAPSESNVVTEPAKSETSVKAVKSKPAAVKAAPKKKPTKKKSSPKKPNK